MGVPCPDIPAQVLAYCAGERNTVEVLETVPRVLNHVEQDEKQDKQQDDTGNPNNNHPPLDHPKNISPFPIFLILGGHSEIVETVIGDQDPGEEKSKHKASNVGKVVDEREETEEEEEENDKSEFDELDPRVDEEA